MDINCTLLVQGLHFFCAYYLLITLLFKPVLAEIAQDDARIDALNASIEKEQKELDALEHERRQLWTVFHNTIAQKREQMAREVPSPLMDCRMSQEYQQLSQDECDKMADVVVDFIVSKACHVGK